MRYQPDCFDSTVGGHRKGCRHRLEMIRPHVEGRVLDVGCAEGYFSFGVADLATEVLGIDRNLKLVRICEQSLAMAPPHVSFLHMHLAEFLDLNDTSWDTVLYLSTHHHLMKQYEERSAGDRILARLFERAGCMLFEMGQKNERKCNGYSWWKNLPKMDDPDAWIQEKLERLSQRSAERIGSTLVHGIQRGLWKVA